MINEIKTQQIALEVIRVLKTRFDNFPENADDNRNAPFHEAFLNAFKNKIEKYVDNVSFFISLSSWLHGLNTTLGQSFFENVAHILSDGEKRTFKNCKITNKQSNTVLEIITDLKNGKRKPNLKEENEHIFQFDENDKLVDVSEFTADVFIIENDYIEAVEIKSVRPNAGEMRGEKLKILSAKACLKRKFPDKEIRYFIGFPFDPLSETPTGNNKQRFIRHLIEFEKYFDPEEVLLAGEFWDRLSGEENTMEKLLEIINKIAKPDFLEKYEFINYPDNFEKDKDRYLSILEEWYLFNEIELFKNYEILKSKYSRLINQQLFNNGRYNEKRLNLIKNSNF